MNNFILESSLENLSICDDLIEFHKNSNQKTSGLIGGVLNKTAKASTDLILYDEELLRKYLSELYKCVDEYVKLYFYSGDYGKWKINEDVKIQHYSPKEGFHCWHSERTHNKSPEVYRHLVFMTYLNDVDDGGETEFFYQNIKVKPKKGKTLIWPADWTHTHRGITSLTQEKYIITGWFSYY
jgi:prolyl 4-hydroxylase